MGNRFAYPQLIIFMSLLQFSCITAKSNSTDNDAPKSLTLVESFVEDATGDDPKIDNTFEVWLGMIKGAKHKIDFSQTYFFTQEANPQLQTILKALHDAGSRGVKLRMLVSDHLVKNSPDGIGKSIEELKLIPNVEMRVTERWAAVGGILHSKYINVDDREVYLGSANFDWKALNHIVELGIKITDSRLIKKLDVLFQDDWEKFENLTANQDLPGDFSEPSACPSIEEDCKAWLAVSPNAMGLVSDHWDLKYFLELIHGAKSHIRLSAMLFGYRIYRSKNKFFVIQDALAAAAKRGVKVEVLVDDINEDKYLSNLLRFGIEVKKLKLPDYKTGPIPYARLNHAKYMVVDNRISWIGTSNLEAGYFYSSRGVSLFIESPLLAGQIIKLFKSQWESSYANSIK